MHKCRLLLLLGLAITAPAHAQSDDEVDEQEAEARKLCDEFWQSFLDRDLDAIMKKVSVPFYEYGDGKSRVFRDMKQLRGRIESHLPDSDDLRQVKFVIKTVVEYAKLLESNTTRTNEQEDRLLDEVLSRDSRVLHLEVQRADGSMLDTIITLIAWRDGRARIVGVRD